MKTLILLFVLSSCSHLFTPQKKNLVLIQGVHLDGKSWANLMKHLPAERYNVTVLDRLGRDEKSPSLNRLARMSCEAIAKKSILVAHSFGGAIATTMYGVCPEKISKIIFVSAVVPQNGEKPFDQLKDKAAQKVYGSAVTIANGRITPKDPGTFYPLTDPTVDLKDPELPKLYSESLKLLGEVVNYDQEQFLSLPKSYIVTMNDPAVALSDQQSFVKNFRIMEKMEIQTGHFPMISRPQILAEMILNSAD